MAEIAGDLRTDLGIVPQLVGLPSEYRLENGEFRLLGQLRLHGNLQVAIKLVASSKSFHPAPPPSSSSSTSSTLFQSNNSQLSNHQDDELLHGILEEGIQFLHFVQRHLFLFDRALVIADPAIQVVSTSSTTDANPTDRQNESNLQCRFRHALPVEQIFILVCVCVCVWNFISLFCFN